MSTVACLGVVVVVEDDDDTRELLQTVLERRGYRVLTASDGIDGLSLLRATDAVCFVLLDLFMPRMDGLGLLRAMSDDLRLAELPVCISTSAPDVTPPGLACLPKPIDLPSLFAMIDSHCAASDAAPTS
ncbi:MAG TPA: response regulator [Polyangiaceae bacterium]|nr:response regulator [Polyangiaceae bacterium]